MTFFTESDSCKGRAKIISEYAELTKHHTCPFRLEDLEDIEFRAKCREACTNSTESTKNIHDRLLAREPREIKARHAYNNDRRIMKTEQKKQ